MTRIAELSRPDYARDLADYARLEYPHEDPRTVSLLALLGARPPTKSSRRWFRFFRDGPVTKEAVPAKA